MRVLDGTGSGVLAFHAAEFVGPSGTVIGTDLMPTSRASALGRRRAPSLVPVLHSV